MSDSNTLLQLAKVVTKQSHTIDLLLQIVVDMCCVTLSQLEKCAAQGCEEPATMKEDQWGICMCDHHAAQAIVAAKTFKDGEGKEFGETQWKDVDEAESIRHISECVKMIKAHDGNVPTIN